MITYNDIQIYINHTCDLACPGCITFNNLNWEHHFSFEELEPELNKWPQKVKFNEIFLLGGEPLLHPELKKWMLWVEQAWPDSLKHITTNGRHIHKLDDIYPDWDKKWKLEISTHSKNDYNTAKSYIDKKWSSVDIETVIHPEAVDAYKKHVIKKENKFKAILSESWDFYNIHENVVFNNSHISWKKLNDPQEQWNKCPGKMCKYLLNGKLYQCPLQAIFPHLAKDFVIDEKYKHIVDQDFGCTADDFEEWNKSYYKPNSQCSLCTWNDRVNILDDDKTEKVFVEKIQIIES